MEQAMSKEGDSHFGVLWRAMRVIAAGLALTNGIALGDLPRYRIIVVEPPENVEPDGFDVRIGINRRGEIVGTVIESASTYPFVWLPTANYGCVAGTSALPVDPQGWDFKAFAINFDGIAVGSGSGVSEVSTGAWLWDLNTNDSYLLYLFGGFKEQAFGVSDDDPPVIVGEAWTSFNPITVRGFRMVLGDPAEELDAYSTSHDNGGAWAVSLGGLAVGESRSGDTPPACGEAQSYQSAVVWEPESSTPAALTHLSAGFKAVPLDVNDEGMIVGYGEDPDDPQEACRERALFWSDPASAPILLPFLRDGSNAPIVDLAMRATAVSNPFSDGIIHAVGRGFITNSAVLWRYEDEDWQPYDLNTMLSCGGIGWSNLSHALNINDNGWIVYNSERVCSSPNGSLCWGCRRIGGLSGWSNRRL
jgi:hypothetical protein